MRVKFSNIGPIKEGEVELEDNLIVLCGKNNTGKTYLAYTLFGLYKIFNTERMPVILHDIDDLQGELFTRGSLTIDLQEILRKTAVELAGIAGKRTKEHLASIFAADENSDSFRDTLIAVTDIDISNYTQQILKLEVDKKIRVGAVLFEFIKEKGDNALNIFMIVDEQAGEEISINQKLQRRIIGDEITKMVVEVIFNNVYIAPAERTSINLFSTELSIRRNALVEELLGYGNGKKAIGPFDLINKRTIRYTWPIRESLNIAEYMKESQSLKSKYKYLADFLEKEIMGGKVKVSKEGYVSFVPAKSDKQLDIHLTASIVKSLASIVFYFRHLAQLNDFIIIDEPELNLHPDNQRRIAKFIARVVNAGFKVMISTHSDYIIRETNNLIMLNNNSRDASKLMKEFGYAKEELLDAKDIGVYLLQTDGSVSRLPVTNTGFEVDTIDDEINQLNESAEKIFFTLYE